MFNLFNTTLTPKKAIEMLTPIPKEEFTTGVFSRPSVKQCCAMGHLRRLLSKNPDNYSAANDFNKKVNKLDDKVQEYTKKKHGYAYGIPSINDRDDINGYNEDNPKDRIMHVLKEML